MNWKRMWLAALVVFVVFQVTNIIIHGAILGSRYIELQAAGVFKESMPGWVFWVTAIIFSYFFALIFAKGYEGRGLMEGVRYGFYIGMIFVFVSSFNQFTVYRISYGLTWYWIILGLIQMILCGVGASMTYKRATAAAA